MKALLAMAVFCLSSVSSAAEVSFIKLSELKGLNSSGFVMSNGAAVKLETLKATQSYCGTFVDHELPAQYTQPVEENLPYSVNMRNDYSNNVVRVFSLHTEDKNGFATGAFYCVAISDKNQSAIQILQKHVGTLITVSQ